MEAVLRSGADRPGLVRKLSQNETGGMALRNRQRGAESITTIVDGTCMLAINCWISNVDGRSSR